MFCKNCGNKILDDAKFCGFCGYERLAYTSEYEENEASNLFDKKCIKIGSVLFMIAVLLRVAFSMLRYEIIYVPVEIMYEYNCNSSDSYYNTEILKYDEVGNCIESVTYNQNDKMMYKGISVFDDVGNRTKVISYGYDEYGKNNYEQITRFVYDEQGDCIEKYDYNENGKEYLSKRNIYDKEKHLIEELSYDETAEITGRHTAEYDKKGNCVKDIWWNKDGSIYETIEREFDVNGKCLNYKLYLTGDEYGDPANLYGEYVYDTYGNRVEEITYDNITGESWSEKYRYDISGNMIERLVYDEKGHLEYHYTYRYNEHGYCIEEKVNDYCQKTTYKELKVPRKDWSFGLFTKKETENVL